MSDRRINICMYTDSLDPSGVGTHMALLIEGLDPDLFAVHLVCPPSHGGQELARQAIAHGATYHPINLRPEQGWQEYDLLTALLLREQVDVFHAHAGATWECHLGILAAAEVGVPAIICTEHLPFVLDDSGEIETKRQVNMLLDTMVAVSRDVAESHKKSGTVDARKLVVVPNGIDPRPYLPSIRAAKRAEMGINEATPLIVTVARFYEQKGHYYLLEAMRDVLREFPGAGLLLVGDGELFWQMHYMAGQLGVGHRAWFVGRRADVSQILCAADVFVLPSLFEGMPLSVMEAMAAGLPVVGTTVSGTSEVVAHGETGLLVPPYDSAGLARALIRLLGDPQLREKMGSKGRERLLAHFTAERMVERNAGIYQHLLARAGARKAKDLLLARTQWDHRQASPARAAAQAL